MSRFFDEYAPLIAKDNDGRVLVHTVLLPDQASGLALCEMSHQLASGTSNLNDIYYRLTTKAEWSFASMLLFDPLFNPGDFEDLPRAEEKLSYPHLTLFHAWMLPSDIPAYVQTVAAQAPYIKVPEDLKMTGPLHFELPHWRDAKSVAATTDDIFWTGVEPAPLRGLQEQLASTAAQVESCTITTPLGENWKTPHFTLLGRSKSSPDHLVQQPNTYSLEKPKLAIGFSGRNGQFRAPFMVIDNETKRVTSLDVANLRLQTLLQMAA